jgi:hypothetical protein
MLFTRGVEQQPKYFLVPINADGNAEVVGLGHRSLGGRRIKQERICCLSMKLSSGTKHFVYAKVVSLTMLHLTLNYKSASVISSTEMDCPPLLIRL